MSHRKTVLPRGQCAIIQAARNPVSELAMLYRVPVDVIERIRRGDISVEGKGPRHVKKQLTPAQRAEIAEDQRTCAAIAASYGVSRMAVSMIKRGTWGKNSDGEPVRIRGLADAAVRE